MDAVCNGIEPVMPGLASMTKKQVVAALQSIWTLLDETGVQRRNETSPQTHLGIYGRVLGAIRNGTLDRQNNQAQRSSPKEDAGRKGTVE